MVSLVEEENQNTADGGGALFLVAVVISAALILRNRTPDAGERISDYIDSAMTLEQTGESAGSDIEDEIISHVAYSVLEKSEDTVRLSITAPDMSALVDEMIAHCASQEDGSAYLLDALEDGDFETVTSTFEVELDENGAPVDSYAFADAMYGGLLTKMEELLTGGGAE